MDANAVNPTPMTPAAPVAPMQAAKTSNGARIAVIISVAVAICGLGFGIFGMTKASEKKVDLSDLEVQVKTETGETTTIKTPEVTTTDNDKQVITIPQNQVSKPENLNHYIYVAQWGIKIKFPSTMTITGYRYALATAPSIGIFAQNCAEDACQYMPDFANPRVSNSPLGAITRVDNTSNIEQDTNLLGTKVVSFGNYDYYYSHPQVVYSEDANEITMETSTVQLLQETLTNASNYSEI